MRDKTQAAALEVAERALIAMRRRAEPRDIGKAAADMIKAMDEALAETQ